MAKRLNRKVSILVGVMIVLCFLPGDLLLAIIGLRPTNSNFIMSCLSGMLIFAIALLGMILTVAIKEYFLPQINRTPIRQKNISNQNAYSIINYNNITVNYSWRLNGGGILFAYEFARIVSKKIGKVKHIFEYCAGPGFIGFNLLANNLCDRLTLADINPEAVAAIKETIRENHLENRVNVYHSDCLNSIPPTEKWDLVVGNPPWDLSTKDNKDIRVCDAQSRVHQQFYRDITKFLKPHGSIIFIEGAEYTEVSCFKKMIEYNNLEIRDSFRATSLASFFSGMNEYCRLNFSLIIFLRLSLLIREAYFIWVRQKES